MLAVALSGCEEAQSPPARTIAHGDAKAGAALIRQYGCASCHAIPGIRGADGIVGPSLRAFAVRAYIGGVHPNTPETLVRWIMDAPGMSPDTAMPDMSIPEDHARDIAVYLHTLR
jgi:cytochrome c